MQEVFNRYINYLEAERGASPYTIRNYTSDLLGNYARGTERGFFQFLRLKKITSLAEVDKTILRSYISWLMGQGIVKPSIARKLSAIRSFYRYLLREGVLSSNPIEKVSSPKLDKRLPSFLTMEETVRLLEAPDLATPQKPRDRALSELFYSFGLGVNELVSLNLEQINLDTNEIRVCGEGFKERVVLTSESVSHALNTYIEQDRPKLLDEKENNVLFLSHRGERISAQSMQKMLEKYAVGQRDRALLELLYASGLRVSELVGLNLGQVDLTSSEIRVWGKGSKERMVLIGEPAARALNTYISHGRAELLGKEKSEALFLSHYGKRLLARRVQKILEKYAVLTHIDKWIHPHLLRHTFATHLLDGGADLRVVQELLGHARLSSTQIYTHLSQGQARKIYLSAHPMAKKKENESENR